MLFREFVKSTHNQENRIFKQIAYRSIVYSLYRLSIGLRGNHRADKFIAPK